MSDTSLQSAARAYTSQSDDLSIWHYLLYFSSGLLAVSVPTWLLLDYQAHSKPGTPPWQRPSAADELVISKISGLPGHLQGYESAPDDVGADEAHGEQGLVRRDDDVEEESVFKMLTDAVVERFTPSSYRTAFSAPARSMSPDRKLLIVPVPSVPQVIPPLDISERMFKRNRNVSFFWFLSRARDVLPGAPSLSSGSHLQAGDLYLHTSDSGHQIWYCASVEPTQLWESLEICGRGYMFPGFKAPRILIVTGGEPSWVLPGTYAKYRQEKRDVGRPAVGIVKIEEI